MTTQRPSYDVLLRLAEALHEYDDYTAFFRGTHMPGDRASKVIATLNQYRAEIAPKLRSRAEVEHEFVDALHAAPSAVYGNGEVKFLGVNAGRIANLRLELDQAKLREPTAPTSEPNPSYGPSGVESAGSPPSPCAATGATSSEPLEDPECNCDQALELRRKLDEVLDCRICIGRDAAKLRDILPRSMLP